MTPLSAQKGKRPNLRATNHGKLGKAQRGEIQVKPPINPKQTQEEREKKSENYHGLCPHRNKKKKQKERRKTYLK